MEKFNKNMPVLAQLKAFLLENEILPNLLQIAGKHSMFSHTKTAHYDK